MNTHAHAVINLALIGRSGDSKHTLAVLFGSVLPDLQIFGFYLLEKLRGTPEADIWSTRYFEVHEAFDWLNSIPLAAVGLLIAWRAKARAVQGLFAGLILHFCADLLLHVDDAHRHFLPFSEWRFVSPVSYWDPAHYGVQATIAEFTLVCTASYVLARRHPRLGPRIALGAVVATYIAAGIGFVIWTASRS